MISFEKQSVHPVFNAPISAIAWDGDDLFAADFGGGLWRLRSGSVTMLKPPTGLPAINDLKVHRGELWTAWSDAKVRRHSRSGVLLEEYLVGGVVRSLAFAPANTPVEKQAALCWHQPEGGGRVEIRDVASFAVKQSWNEQWAMLVQWRNIHVASGGMNMPWKLDGQYWHDNRLSPNAPKWLALDYYGGFDYRVYKFTGEQVYSGVSMVMAGAADPNGGVLFAEVAGYWAYQNGFDEIRGFYPGYITTIAFKNAETFAFGDNQGNLCISTHPLVRVVQTVDPLPAPAPEPAPAPKKGKGKR